MDSEPLVDVTPLRNLGWPFPAAIIEAIRLKPERYLDSLLAAVEEAAALPILPKGEAHSEDLDCTYYYALPLLGEFRESRAFPAILRLIQRPDVDDLLGDMITELLPAILAGTCGDGFASLKKVVENRKADEWVRGAAYRALGVLAAHQLWPLEQYANYSGLLLNSLLELRPNAVWDAVAAGCADFHLVVHLPAIKSVYKRGFIDPGGFLLEELVNSIKEPHAPGEFSVPYRYRLIEDTGKELSSWAAFDNDPGEPYVDELSDGAPVYSAPLVRPTPKIGRNDPCPCSSGLKYKRCCGATPLPSTVPSTPFNL